MSDVESRLRDTLTERAADAPGAAGLVDGARRRLRRRRTTRAVAAAAVVAAAIPVGLGLGGSEPAPDDTSPVASGPPAIADGFRAESWRNITLEVPVDWGYGGVTAWCAGGSTPADAQPVVTRPDTIMPMIRCSPGSGYGATISSAAAFDPAYASGKVWRYDTEGVVNAQYPDDTWLSYWYDGSDVVTVATPDRGLTTRIVDSVTRFEGVDPNDCPVTVGEAEALTGSTSDSFSICRYDRDGLLTASRRFVGRQAQEVQDAVLSGPVRTIVYDCPDPGPLPRSVLLQGGGYVGTVVTDAGCEGRNGVFLSGTVHELTDQVRRRVDLTRLP